MIMAKQNTLKVKDTMVQTISINGTDYVSITDIARFKNPLEPKDVVKNWMRTRNTIEYLGLWEKLNNPNFKGVEFDPLMQEAGSNAFTMSPSRWIETTGAIGIVVRNGKHGGTYAHNMLGQHGKHQRLAHQRWRATRRKTSETQQDCHSADAGIGGQREQKALEISGQ